VTIWFFLFSIRLRENLPIVSYVYKNKNGDMTAAVSDRKRFGIGSNTNWSINGCSTLMKLW